MVGQCEAEISTHLEHGLDTSVADLGTGCNDVLAALLVSETGLDELLSVLDKQVPDSLVADRGDFDELGETVSDLSNGESFEEGEVEEGVERSVVGTESSCQQPRWSNTDRSTYRFFSFRWLSPTLIETEASMRPIKVVGIRMKLEVRR